MWIKICANTNLEDALLAADRGANAVGFVFARSSRQITPEQAGEIASELPESVERIGVFDTHDAGEIARAVEQAELTGIQLHGALDVRLAHDLAERFGSSITVIQALPWETTGGSPAPADQMRTQLRVVARETAMSRVLVDSKVRGATGGTGVVFDWQAAAEVLREELGRLQLIVAGGLTPDNVEEAIGRLRPWGVDVATGVEASPGKKDAKKLEAFLEKASR